MFELPISRCARRLTEAEKEQFQNWGYVKNLPVFDDSQIPILQMGFEDMLALLPPQNASGNFVKVVQRVPIKITFDIPENMIGRIVPGLSVYVSIETKN